MRKVTRPITAGRRIGSVAPAERAKQLLRAAATSVRSAPSPAQADELIGPDQHQPRRIALHLALQRLLDHRQRQLERLRRLAHGRHRAVRRTEGQQCVAIAQLLVHIATRREPGRCQVMAGARLEAM